jgi:hypothetical protein
MNAARMGVGLSWDNQMVRDIITTRMIWHPHMLTSAQWPRALALSRYDSRTTFVGRLARARYAQQREVQGGVINL